MRRSSAAKFLWRSGDIGLSQCIKCTHAWNDNNCEAFPEGIPEVILDNKHDHTLPYKGDRGIRFEKVQGA